MDFECTYNSEYMLSKVTVENNYIDPHTVVVWKPAWKKENILKYCIIGDIIQLYILPFS